MTVQQAYEQLIHPLFTIYDNREAANISDWVVEHLTGMKKTDRYLNRDYSLTEQQISDYNQISLQLLKRRPLQYVLGEAWFSAMKLYVDERVLIPRPETEELVEIACRHITQNNIDIASKPSLIDLGTGSGCIALAIKKKISALQVYGVDFSPEALEVARYNAKNLKLDVEFLQADITQASTLTDMKFNFMISNPPYIEPGEAAFMEKHVLQYEPHHALFTPENEPILFYCKIIEMSRESLVPGGLIFFEINDLYSKELSAYTTEQDFIASSTILKDYSGKDRFMILEKSII
jgi:release factor glutamine methyltransferase